MSIVMPLALVALLALSSADARTIEMLRGLRGNSTSGVVTQTRPCTLWLKDVQYEGGFNEEKCDCELDPEDAGGEENVFVEIKGLHLTAESVDDEGNKLESGVSTLHMPGMEIDRGVASVSLPQGGKIGQFSLKFGRRERTGQRSLAVVTGERKVLAIRVVDGNGVSTGFNETYISDEIFGTNGDPVNLRTQYLACSANKLDLAPFSGQTSTGVEVVNGVQTISISAVANGQSDSIIRDAAVSTATGLLGSLTQFNHVMLCLPPGTTGGWIAYAYVNSWLSVYNNEWCNYVSGQMHELGHNLNLAHSGETSTYDDTSGFMGFSYSQDNQRMCFNGAKNWQLGWYEDRHSVATPLTSNWRGNLVGLSDYGNSLGKTVILKIDGDSSKDYYVTFNRRTGINENTGEGADQVLVHERIPFRPGAEYATSKLLAKLNSGAEYRLSSFNGGDSVLVKVHTINTTLSSPSPYYANVEVKLDSTASPTQAPVSSTATPTPAPVSSPDAPTPVPIDIGEGYCASFKELQSGLGISGCFAAAAADDACVNKDQISYGKGSRSGRCLCDTISDCEANAGLTLGVDGYDRFSTDPPSPTPAPVSSPVAPTPVPIDIGEGYCASFKELQSGLGISGCFAAADADGACVNKDRISYGKGSRSGRCLCDTISDCEATAGLTLGANGYDRFSTEPPSPTPAPVSTPDAPTPVPIDIGEGYCASFKELQSGLGISGCFAAAAADDACVNKDQISYGKGSRSGRCLCDTISDCEANAGLTLGADGYDRFSSEPFAPPTESPVSSPVAPTEAPVSSTTAPTAEPSVGPTQAPVSSTPSAVPSSAAPTQAPSSASPTQAPSSEAPTQAPVTSTMAPTAVPIQMGEGYCASFKELQSDLGVLGCFAAAFRDDACVNKNKISYGKGSRSGRCLCDTISDCEANAGLTLGTNGYDRFITCRGGSGGHSTG